MKKILTKEQKEDRRERARLRRMKRAEMKAATVTAEEKKERKKEKREERKSKEPKMSFELFSCTASMLEHPWHRFCDSDSYKSVSYFTNVNGRNLMHGLYLKIDEDGRVSKSEYEKAISVEESDGFVGWVKSSDIISLEN